MKKYLKCVIILLGLFLCLIMISCNKNQKVHEIKDDIKPFFLEVYNYVNDYVYNKVGTDYKLYQVRGKYQKDKNEYFEFIYTKRCRYFNDVYFVKVYTQEKKLTYKVQNEAERLYGRNITLQPTSWEINIDEIVTMNTNERGEKIQFDVIEFYTSLENTIIINFLNKNGEIIISLNKSL